MIMMIIMIIILFTNFKILILAILIDVINWYKIIKQKVDNVIIGQSIIRLSKEYTNDQT